MKWTLILTISLLAASCAENGTEEARHGALDKAVESPSPSERKAANQYEREAKVAAANAGPNQPVAEKVAWDETVGFPTADAKLLPADQRAKLDAIKVPVLAFPEAELLDSALVTHNVDWYVVAVKGDGVHMNVRGTRNAITVPGMEIPKAAREAAANYTLSRTHGIVTVAWRSFNVSYTLDVECAKPMDDARCTEDDYALQVAEKLAIIGGSR